MRADLFCDEGIAGIAAGAFYSKFHFTREFSRHVGTTPRRFLAALRMQRAIHILLTTDLSIADAGTMVGYSSVGTFSTRFSSLVGMSPRAWRTCHGRPEPIAETTGPGLGQLRGRVEMGSVASDTEYDIFVGAFPDSVVQGRPVAATRLTGPGSFVLHGVPEGQWTVAVLCRVASPQAGTQHVEWLRASTGMTSFDDPSTEPLATRIRPRPARPADPPVLLGGTHEVPAPTLARQRNREYPLDRAFADR